MNKNNELTIIIATYNRSKKIKNFLDFISAFKIGVNVVIADGSTNKYDRYATIEIIKKFPQINIKYFYSNKNPHSRMFLALKKIKSKYYKISSDDDFFTSEFINFSIETLNKNKKTKSVSGNELIVRKLNNNLIYDIDISDKSKHFDYSNFFNANGGCSYLFNVYRYGDLHKILYTIKQITKIISFEKNLNNKFITWWFQEIVFKYYIYQTNSIIHSTYISHIRIDHNEVWGMRSHNLNFLDFSFPKKLNHILEIINNNLFKKKNFNNIKLIWLNDIYKKTNRIFFEFKVNKKTSFNQKLLNLSLKKVFYRFNNNRLYKKLILKFYLNKNNFTRYLNFFSSKKIDIFKNK